MLMAFFAPLPSLAYRSECDFQKTMRGAEMKKLTTEDVAKRYQVNPDTVRLWIRSNLMPATDCRRPSATRARYRMDEDDLEIFEQRRAASQKTREARQRVKAAESGAVYV